MTAHNVHHIDQVPTYVKHRSDFYTEEANTLRHIYEVTMALACSVEYTLNCYFWFVHSQHRKLYSA